MGCSHCGHQVLVSNQSSNYVNTNYKAKQSLEPCDYNNDTLKSFYDTLIYFKDSALFLKNGVDAPTLNRYIGIVLTSLSVSNKCLYKETLGKISDLVDLIISIKK